MKPLLLCILDGIGMCKGKHGNAFRQAKTPNFDLLWKTYPHSYLEASGEAVGLPKGQMGNSEVGHLNIGAGRVVYQPLQMITKQIEEGTFYQNSELLSVISHVKQKNSKLHILGLLSDGGIHSHIHHLFAMLELCKKEEIEQVYLHLFTDGRDTLTDSAPLYFEQLEQKMKELEIGVIATISGRYYAMDRDNRFDRVEKSYQVMVDGIGKKEKSALDAIQHSYQENITDEFIEPTILDETGCIQDYDGIMVYNYRPDRLRELLGALTNPDFTCFKRTIRENLKLVTMMPVSEEVKGSHAFSLPKLDDTLGEYLSSKGFSQLRIAETEKYAHVTYFFDGGEEKKLKKCDRILIPSPKVSTYDLKPEMSAVEITDTLLTKLDQNQYEVIILNFANGDMLGHTGNIEATIVSLEVMDDCLGKLINKINEKEGTLLVTADHGNCEIMLDQSGNKVTSHTTSLVPFIINHKDIVLKNGKLSDIAPTMLSLLGIKTPESMTGKILLKKKSNYSKWFIGFSILFLTLLVGIYGTRFVHYYRLEHPKIEATDTSLYGHVVGGLTTTGEGLYSEGEQYVFKGNVTNNYVYYSNRYYRIVKINSDKSITLVTDDTVTSMVWNSEGNDYKTSPIRNWLNDNGLENTGIFYKSLNQPDLYLKSTEVCIDESDGEKFTCKKKVNDMVGLLSVMDYKNARANQSYLNIGKYFWTSNADKKENVWYVFHEGGINSDSKEGATYYSYGVRPVITLKSDISLIGGDGTKENPYRIEKENNYTGSYVTYSDSLWRIAASNETQYRLLKEDPIEVGGKSTSHIFSTYSSKYRTSEYTSLASYLNTTYLKTLSDSEILLTVDWNNGTYGNNGNYHYSDVYQEQVKAKIGLPTIGELFTSGEEPYATMTPSNENMIYVVSKDGSLYSQDILSESFIRPMIAISKNTTFSSGSGTKENPYRIG